MPYPLRTEIHRTDLRVCHTGKYSPKGWAIIQNAGEFKFPHRFGEYLLDGQRKSLREIAHMLLAALSADKSRVLIFLDAIMRE